MELTTHHQSYRSDEIPYFSKPTIYGSFSVGSTRNYLPDYSQIKFLHDLPQNSKIRFDLNHNAAKTIPGAKPDERLEFLCHYLRDYKKPLNVFDKSKISLKDVPFVSYRGFLREISAFPYESKEPCRIAVCLLRGVIYMHTLNYAEKQRQKENQSEWEKKCSTWGFKFEQFLLSDESDADPDLESPLNENEEFSCVFAANLSNHKLVYGAEMDGVSCTKSEKISKTDISIEDLQKFKFVELKTSRHITERRHDITFRRHKALTWWLQSYLVGVKAILCGYRDDQGIVTELKSFHVFDLPKRGQQFWQPSVCLNFCVEFLTFVKKCLAQELQRKHGNYLDDVRNFPRVDLFFERGPNSSVKLRVAPDNEDISVIPQWYVDLLCKV